MLKFQQPGYIVALGATPIQQAWAVTMPTSTNAQIKNLFGWVIEDRVKVLNDINKVLGNPTPDLIASVLAPALGSSSYNVTKTQVTNAAWINLNGKAALQYTVTTISDPISMQALILIIAGLVAAIAGVIITSAIIASAISGGVAIGPSLAAVLLALSFLPGLIAIIAGAWNVIQSSGGIAGLLTGNTSGILNDIVAIAAIGLVGVGIVLYFTRK
jgi:uncharacterized Tic20 family protein